MAFHFLVLEDSIRFLSKKLLLCVWNWIEEMCIYSTSFNYPAGWRLFVRWDGWLNLVEYYILSHLPPLTKFGDIMCHCSGILFLFLFYYHNHFTFKCIMRHLNDVAQALVKTATSIVNFHIMVEIPSSLYQTHFINEMLKTFLCKRT
jgi:hypothetical protein